VGGESTDMLQRDATDRAPEASPRVTAATGR
jgi:hypothetical protein